MLVEFSVDCEVGNKVIQAGTRVYANPREVRFVSSDDISVDMCKIPVRIDDTWVNIDKRILRRVKSNGAYNYLRKYYTKEERELVLLKSKNKCCCCGKKLDGTTCTVDHVVPISAGGFNHAINLVGLCRECNNEKTDSLLDISYLPYLGKDNKELLSKYIYAFSLFNSRVRFGNFLGLNMCNVNIIVPHSLTGKSKLTAVSRQLRVARYSDLDSIYSFILANYDYSKEQVKDLLSDSYSNSCVYFLSNGSTVILAFTMETSLVGTYYVPTVTSVFTRKDTHFKNTAIIFLNVLISIGKLIISSTTVADKYCTSSLRMSDICESTLDSLVESMLKTTSNDIIKPVELSDSKSTKSVLTASRLTTVAIRVLKSNLGEDDILSVIKREVLGSSDATMRFSEDDFFVLTAQEDGYDPELTLLFQSSLLEKQLEVEAVHYILKPESIFYLEED